MQTQSAVEFATRTRIHMGLGVRNVDRSVAFYRVLLGSEPSKTRPGYAKFEPSDPPVNLSLIETTAKSDEPHEHTSHYGVQVKSVEAVEALSSRLAAAGFSIRREEETDCCYALQTKAWTEDPDGNSWEVFVVLEADATPAEDRGGTCCPGSSCGV